MVNIWLMEFSKLSFVSNKAKKVKREILAVFIIMCSIQNLIIVIFVYSPCECFVTQCKESYDFFNAILPDILRINDSQRDSCTLN